MMRNHAHVPFVSVFLAVFAASGCAEGQTPPATGRPSPSTIPSTFTYHNPIYVNGVAAGSEVRDPCILREAGTYYLVFTMFPFRSPDPTHFGDADMGSSPGVRIYSSKDLTHWRPGNWLLKSSDLPADCPYKHRFWAPEIHKIGGKFYLIFYADNWAMKKPGVDLNLGYFAYVGVADKIDGPYEHVTVIPGGPCDTTLLADDDGRVYAVMPMRDLHIQQIDLSGLPDGKIRFVGSRALAVTADNRDIGLAPHPRYLEGPWAMKRGGRYYLFYAAPYPKESGAKYAGYRTNVAYADSPMGPWKKDPRGVVFYGGHLAVFDGPDGRNWFCYRGEARREARGFLCIDPFNIRADGTAECGDPTVGDVAVSGASVSPDP